MSQNEKITNESDREFDELAQSIDTVSTGSNDKRDYLIRAVKAICSALVAVSTFIILIKCRGY